MHRLNGNTITNIHTYVLEELEGRGIAGQLAQRTCPMLASADSKASPVASYMRRHPEYDEVLAK